MESTRTLLLSGDYPTHHTLCARMPYTDSLMLPDGAKNIIHINDPAVIYFSPLLSALFAVLPY